MKKFLAMFLALSMVLSLCACGGKTPDDTSKSGVDSSVSDVKSGQDDGSVDIIKDVKKQDKVEGDRVKTDGDGGYVATDFTVGEVNAADVITKERMPVDTGKTALTVFGSVSSGGPSIEMIMLMDNGEASGVEITSSFGGNVLTSRMFEVEGEQYAYTSAMEAGSDTVETHVYKIVESEDSSEESSLDMSDSLDIDEEIGTDEVDTKYKSCEYVGLEDGHDVFYLTTVDDEEYTIHIDHTTGWIDYIRYSSDSLSMGEEKMDMSIDIEYNTNQSFDMDVSNAEETDGEDVAFFIFAQIVALAGMDGDLNFDMEMAEGGDISVDAP